MIGKVSDTIPQCTFYSNYRITLDGSVISEVFELEVDFGGKFLGNINTWNLVVKSPK